MSKKCTCTIETSCDLCKSKRVNKNDAERWDIFADGIGAVQQALSVNKSKNIKNSNK